ncbi:3'(2'),5'-bisphosphate nucleotidase CysQ [Leptobacterium sp. I13]|uniref:3'(2'),5'-bisphosphate nucleotidase CysQ n=1 Tax=Leptobacterium meishanense TaxID=3128904 RepID=UPI0030EBD4CA
MLNDNLKIAIEVSVKAGIKILEIYNQEFEIEEKKDNSPLTKADIMSNDVINEYLSQTQIPIISEENREIDYSVRKKWNICWLVDPLDGTKEFIKRNGEFTVNIALIQGGAVKLGVIYTPVTRELYYGDVEAKCSYKIILNELHELPDDFFNENYLISPSDPDDKIKIVGSRSHMNEDTKLFIESIKRKHSEVEIVSKGSSLKFCLVAGGEAHVYPRFAPTMEWDTAAGQAICEAAGLKVIDQTTKRPLAYNKQNLLNNYFLVSR